jgi:DNA end-binding protein Ku
MHTVWKGAISFGLVHVPVKMFSATEDKDISMRMIHKPCSTPLSYVRKCQTCDTEVPWEEIVKGYEHEPGRFVIFDKEELEQLSGEKSKEIKILDFVQLGEIDPVYFQKTYYLAPADTGSNAYNLLLRSLTETGKIGIAKVSIRSKSSLAAIRVVDRCLALETIFFPDEIRPISQVPNLPEQATVNDKELTMAKMLIDQLSTPFEPEKYTDEYRSAVYEAISRKVAGEEIQVAPEQQRTNVIDLMSALEASLEAARSGAKPGGAAAAKTTGTGPAARGSAPSQASAPAADGPSSPAEAGGMTGTEDAKPKRGRPRKSSQDTPSKETL